MTACRWAPRSTSTEMLETEPAPTIPEATPPPTAHERAERILTRLMQRVPPLTLVLVGVSLLLAGLGMERLMHNKVLQLREQTSAARRAEDQSLSATSHFQTLAD